MSNITVENTSYSSSDIINNIGEDEEEEEDFQQHHDQQQQLQNDHEVIMRSIHGCCSNSDEPSTTTNSSSSKPPPAKKKRNLPGTPDPSADVIALSPTTLMATNRFICEICNKGFKRDQNLQLHRRGHNLPWKLRQRTNNEMIRKRVYVCPEPTCIHHNPARALGDLTGIKKHFSRKHGEKIWKCDKCSKKYAVASDWKAHSKTCGTRDYKCDCGTIFSRRDSFITHRAFYDALVEGTNKLPNQESLMAAALDQGNLEDQIAEFISNNSTDHIDDNDLIKNDPMIKSSLPNDLMSIPLLKPLNMVRSMFSNSSSTYTLFNGGGDDGGTISSSFKNCINNGAITPIITESAHMSATALLQKAAQMGATASSSNFNNSSVIDQKSSFISSSSMAGIDIAGGGGGGGFINQFLQDPNHEIPSDFFNTSSVESSGMNDVGMFSGILMDGDDHQNNIQFLKNIEQNDQHSNSSSTSMLVMQGRTINSGLGMNRASGGIRNPIGPSRFRNSKGGGGSGDVTTLDFLGIGGSKSLNLHENNHQQRGLEFEGINNNQQADLQYNFDQQQQFSHIGHEKMEKPVWDV